MADELDLNVGDPSRSSPEAEQRRRRRRDRGESSSTRERAEAAVEAEMRSRLERVFDRIVKARRARDDEELAEIIEEDADAMTQGFISLTDNVPFLRMPLIMLLNVLEPVLAFNRVTRILWIRAIDWRQRRMMMAAQQAEEEAYPGASVA